MFISITHIANCPCSSTGHAQIGSHCLYCSDALFSDVDTVADWLLLGSSFWMKEHPMKKSIIKKKEIKSHFFIYSNLSKLPLTNKFHTFFILCWTSINFKIKLINKTLRIYPKFNTVKLSNTFLSSKEFIMEYIDKSSHSNS